MDTIKVYHIANATIFNNVLQLTNNCETDRGNNPMDHRPGKVYGEVGLFGCVETCFPYSFYQFLGIVVALNCGLSSG